MEFFLFTPSVEGEHKGHDCRLTPSHKDEHERRQDISQSGLLQSRLHHNGGQPMTAVARAQKASGPLSHADPQRGEEPQMMLSSIAHLFFLTTVS